MKFQLKQDGNYNGEIMRFLNHILKIPESQAYYCEQNLKSNLNISQSNMHGNTNDINDLMLEFLHMNILETLFQQFYSDM